MKGKGQTVEESIRIEAYLLSEKAGHPPGMDHYFWEQAQVIVKTRAAAVSTAVKKAADAKSKAKPGAAKVKPAAKLKTAKKEAAAASATAKEPPLPLKDEARAPARKGSSKK